MSIFYAYTCQTNGFLEGVNYTPSKTILVILFVILSPITADSKILILISDFLPNLYSNSINFNPLYHVVLLNNLLLILYAY